MKILIIGSDGYLGSSLIRHISALGHHVDGMDIGYYTAGLGVTENDYNSFDEEFYAGYEKIILLAGHSSVSLCENDITGSFYNNVVNFKNLLSKLTDRHTLLYASSASVYSGHYPMPETMPVTKPVCNYDMHKQVIEKIAAISPVKTIGMRFGTIGGYSENPRLELIINSMYYDGSNKGEIVYNNTGNMRSYLGINDACRAIEKLIEVKRPKSIYNIASNYASISQIAETIASFTKAKLKRIEDNSTYSFAVDTSLASKVINFTDTIESICDGMKPHLLLDKNFYNRNTNLFKYVQKS